MPPALDNLQSLTYFGPELALIAGLVLVILWDLLTSGSTRLRGLVTVTLLALLGSGGLSVAFLSKHTPAQQLFYGLLAFDPFAHLFRVVFALTAAVIVLFAMPSSETGAGTTHRRGAAEFLSLLLVVTLGLNLMVMSRNLLMIYLSLELVSVISFALAGFKINSRRSSEAALKYVIFGGTASGVMLYGMSWLYGFCQSLDLSRIALRIALHTMHDGRIPLVVLVAVVCMLAGFGYKISAAPFHMWTPDVYEGAPTSVTAFLSVGPKAAGFAILIRFFSEALHASAESAGELSPWALLAGMLAMATMIVGNFSALGQNNVKRMLAFSSIAHAGYMLLGFCVFSPAGVNAILFYVITYAFMNLGAFLVVAAVAERNEQNENIEAFYGLGSRAPVLAIAMTIFLFSLTGLPPLAGFVGKFYLFAALLQTPSQWNWVLAAVGVINSVVSLFYYARVIRAMFLTKPADATPFDTRKLWSTATVVLAVPTLALGIYWAPIYDLVSSSLALPR